MAQENVRRIMSQIHVYAPDRVVYVPGAFVNHNECRIVFNGITGQLVASITKAIEFQKSKVIFVAAIESHAEHTLTFADLEYLIAIVARVTTREFVPVLCAFG